MPRLVAALIVGKLAQIHREYLVMAYPGVSTMTHVTPRHFDD
jgi:hypothetical protein